MIGNNYEIPASTSVFQGVGNNPTPAHKLEVKNLILELLEYDPEYEHTLYFEEPPTS